MPHSERTRSLLAAAEGTDGFLEHADAMALFAAGRRAARSGLGPLLEVGSYKGRSALFLAAGIADAVLAGIRPTVVFSVDHHRGSEEMQAGWQHHDLSLVDASGEMDSLPTFRATIERAGVSDLVIGLIGDSPTVGTHLLMAFSLVFLDGGHGARIARADFAVWAQRVAVGGLLVFHDVFEDPSEGGQAPYECYRQALESGEFVADDAASCHSLRVLIRQAADRRKLPRTMW